MKTEERFLHPEKSFIFQSSLAAGSKAGLILARASTELPVHCRVRVWYFMVNWVDILYVTCRDHKAKPWQPDPAWPAAAGAGTGTRSRAGPEAAYLWISRVGEMLPLCMPLHICAFTKATPNPRSNRIWVVWGFKSLPHVCP